MLQLDLGQTTPPHGDMLVGSANRRRRIRQAFTEWVIRNPGAANIDLAALAPLMRVPGHITLGPGS